MTVRMLPKCANGYCGWRGCWDPATSATFRIRISATVVVDVAFCGPHKRYAIPGQGGLMPSKRPACWAAAEAEDAA
jgi:hypothetical protein